MGASTNDGSNIYQYPGMGQASGGALGGAQSLQNSGQQTQDLYNGSLGSNQGLTQGTSYNNQQGVNAGNRIENSVGGLPGYANQALQTGFNQNNGLYNQELQQINDQTNSGLAQRGIAMSPYAAGVQGQVDTNFNNTWNNQLLQNQQAGAGTANSLLGQYGNSTMGGAATAQGGANNSLSALSSLIGSGNQSSAQSQAAIADYLSYLSGGTGASTGQASAQNQAAQIDNQSMSGFGSLFGNLFKGSGTGLFGLG